MQPEALNSTFNCFIDGCAAVVGFCNEDGTCVCRTGFSSQDCSFFIYEASESTWSWFIFQMVFFALVFAALMIWALVEIILMVKRAEGNVKEINKFTLQIYIVIAFLGLIRVLYTLLYQEGRFIAVPTMAGTIIHGLGISAYMYIQFTIAYIWIDAYLHTKPNPKRLIKGLQSRTFVFIIVTFAVQITHDIITSLPQLPAESRQGFQGFYFCYMFVVGTTTSVGLLVAGYRVQKQLKLFKDVDRSRKRLLKRMNALAVTSSIVLIVVIFLLVALIVVTFTGQDSELSAMVANPLMRAVESTYCLVILGVYRTRVMAPSSSSSNHTSSPGTGTGVEMHKESAKAQSSA